MSANWCLQSPAQLDLHPAPAPLLLRNHVFPDKTSERCLRSALEVISLAGVQLPLTEKISKALPDEFSLACQACWGRKADSSWASASDSEEVDLMTGEPAAKLVKGNSDSDDYSKRRTSK